MTEVAVVTDLREAAEMAVSWRNCIAPGASEVFTSPEWCLSAWRSFPELGEPRLFVSRDHDGGVLGVAPLTLTPDGMSFAGSPLGDEHDVRVHPESDPMKVGGALIAAMRKSQPTAAGACLRDVRPGGVLDSLGQNTAVGCPSPVIPLHQPADTNFGTLSYVPGWSKGRRKMLRGLSRRLSEVGSTTFDALTDQSQVKQLVPDFVRGRIGSWEQRGRLEELPELDRHPACPEFLATAAAALAGRGRFFVARLLCANHPVAQNLCFRTNDSVVIYMTTYDPEFSRYSPSHLLLAELARYSFAQGIRILEYGRGDEPYKFAHGAEVRFLCDVTLR